MSIKKFTDTAHCRSGRVCRQCRDLDGGRAFRQSLIAKYPMDTVDFECPFSGKWDHPELARPPLLRRAEPVHREPPPPGAGDKVYNLLNKMGIASAVEWLSAKTGTGCGCKSRRRLMNQYGFIKWIWKQNRI
jgi:hypothetical protein